LAYFAPLAVALTLGGAAYIQIKNVLDGKEPEPMGPDNGAFWLRALSQGGGFGLFGDFVSANENRFGGTLAESIAGPGVSFWGDTLGLLLGNAQSAISGEKINPGRQVR